MSKADTQASNSSYYVYALCRGDTGEPFYLGKGVRDRWLDHERRALAGDKGHKCNIIRDLKARGFPVIKVKIHEELTAAAAGRYEMALIKAIGRGRAGPLTNLTDGGDGSAGCFPSPETRAKLSAARTGRKLRPESIEKTAAAHRGRKRPPETGAKISERARVRSPSQLAQIAALNSSRSPEAIARAVAAMRAGQTPGSIAKAAAFNRGKKRSPETRAKQSAAALGRKQTPEHVANRRAARLAADARRRAEAAALGRAI